MQHRRVFRQAVVCEGKVLRIANDYSLYASGYMDEAQQILRKIQIRSFAPGMV